MRKAICSVSCHELTMVFPSARDFEKTYLTRALKQPLPRYHPPGLPTIYGRHGFLGAWVAASPARREGAHRLPVTRCAYQRLDRRGDSSPRPPRNRDAESRRGA
jgi:hypothetical protein